MGAKLLFIAIGLGVAAHFAVLVVKIWAIRREGAEAWAGRDPDAPELAGLNEAGFRRAHFRAYGPVGGIHGYVALLGAALVTVPALLIFGAVWRIGWELADKPISFEPGLLMQQFFMFFALIVSWALIAGLVMRRYHKNRPRELRFELARERERAGARLRTRQGDADALSG